MFLLNQYEKKIREFKGAHAPAETSVTKTFTITVYLKVPTVQQLSDKLEEAAGLRMIKGELQTFRSDNQDHRALYNALYEKTDTLEKYYVTKVETWASEGIPMLNVVLRKVTRNFTR